MKGWAIKWPSGWIDNRTVSSTRKDAWLCHSTGAMASYRAYLKRIRRNGTLRAFKVELKEIQP